MNVNESKFDGVIIDDEVEGVDEGSTVAWLPVTSGLARRSQQTIDGNGLHAFPWGRQSEPSRRWQHAYVPDDELQWSFRRTISDSRRGGRQSPFRISQNTDTRNDCLHAGCISAPSALADDRACVILTAKYFSHSGTHQCRFAFCEIPQPYTCRC